MLLTAMLFVLAQGEKTDAELRERAAWIDEHAVPVRTIEPDDRDFEDLEPLPSLIGGARVVVLGEITHTDGATFRARNRVIAFLHERMGFDVIAWEAGLLDCRRMSEALRGSGSLDAAAQQMMRGGWDASAEVRPLFEYVRQSWQTPRPIEMTGFDGPRPPHGREHLNDLLDDLIARVPEVAPSRADLDRIREIFRRCSSFFSADHGNVPPDQRAAERASLERLVDACEQQRDRLDDGAYSPRESAFVRQVLRGSLVHEEAQWLMGRRLATGDAGLAQRWNDLRDREMARTFLWLVDDYYRDRKIIVLAATAHLTRSTGTIQALEAGMSYAGVEQMGDHVSSELREGLYTIAFTAYQGEVGIVMSQEGVEPHVTKVAAEPPPAGSIEDLCHRTQEPYLFVDLRGVPADHWLRRPLVAWPLGFQRSRADWSRVVDAFFFIDTMTPDRRRRE